MNRVNSLVTTCGKLEIPLVVIHKGEKLLGFVPALNIEGIWGEIGKENEIIQNLKIKTKAKVKEMVKLNQPFPFFPDSSMVTFEFSPVKMEILVAHISNKNANNKNIKK